jgi:hypothetical protein
MKRGNSFWTLGSIVIALVLLAFIRGSAAQPAVPDPMALQLPGTAKLKWSTEVTETTKEKNIQFHGVFCKEDIAVTCDDLGDHDFIEVSFDLLILCSWDGAFPVPAGTWPQRIGPDYFRLGIKDGPTLLYTIFSNIPVNDPGFAQESKAQTYPSQIPGVRLPPQMGAKEANTLGYIYPMPGPPQPIPMDATYAIHFIVPHKAPQAVLQLNGLNLQDRVDENWGVANLQVHALRAAQVPKPTADDIAIAFMDSLNPLSANLPDSFQTLINGMDATTDWIEKNVQPMTVDSAKLTELLKAFADDKQLLKQEDARLGLRDFGHAAEPALRDMRKTANTGHQQAIDTILETFGVNPPPDDNAARVILATRALEIIGTPNALALRNKLVGLKG